MVSEVAPFDWQFDGRKCRPRDSSWRSLVAMRRRWGDAARRVAEPVEQRKHDRYRDEGEDTSRHDRLCQTTRAALEQLRAALRAVSRCTW